MGSFSIAHWLIVLVVVSLIFGTKKLRNIGSDLGAGIKAFKDGLNQEKQHEQEKIAQQQDSNSIQPLKDEQKS